MARLVGEACSAGQVELAAVRYSLAVVVAAMAVNSSGRHFRGL